MHTDHSHDCATPVEVLLATARDQGLGAIAVTDHNEVSGALEAQRRRPTEFGVKVIVAEEVKTAHQGEVIGLFLEGEDPARDDARRRPSRRSSARAASSTCPHPFDRMHAVPDYEHLLTIVDDIDAIEVYNPRVAIGSFNEEAARFAAKYRILAGAGSDAHVAQGLGSVRDRACATSTGRRSSWSRCARPRSSPSRRAAVRPGAEVPGDEGHARRAPGAARRERRVRRATRKA